jgi:hypothetical protein
MDTTTRKAIAVWGPILMVPMLACTSAPKAETKDGVPATRVACFEVDKVRSYVPLHESFVYLEVGADEHYLLSVTMLDPDAKRRFPSRPFADEIVITGYDLRNSFKRVCFDTQAEAAYMEKGEPVYRRIWRVEAVAGLEAAKKIVAIRTAPPSKSP